MGRRRLSALAQNSQARIVGVVEREKELGKRAAAEFSCSYFSTLEEALERATFDSVFVSVPNAYHAELTKLSLQEGKHVFCEKPLARNPKEGQEMVEAAEKNGVHLKVGANLRFFPNVMKAKELLDRKSIGELLFLRSWIGHNGWNLNNPWYRSQEMTGGGTMLDNGCHIFDMMRWFIGELKSCTGVAQNLYWNVASLEDNGFGIFETASGKVATLQASWSDWAGYMYMELYGTKGYIRIDSRSKNCLTVLGQKDGEEDTFDFSTFPPQSYQLEVNAYIQALISGKEPSPNGRDGLRAVEAAYALYESARTGRKVAF